MCLSALPQRLVWEEERLVSVHSAALIAIWCLSSIQHSERSICRRPVHNILIVKLVIHLTKEIINKTSTMVNYAQHVLVTQRCYSYTTNSLRYIVRLQHMDISCEANIVWNPNISITMQVEIWRPIDSILSRIACITSTSWSTRSMNLKLHMDCPVNGLSETPHRILIRCS